jgi:hypothetical protein
MDVLWLLMAVFAGVAGVFGVVWYRGVQRRKYDHMRRTYVAHFPADLPHDAVLNFLRALSGLPTPRLFEPVHTVVFEIYADVTGVTHLISIPGHVVADVEGYFRTHIVGGSLVKAELEMPSWDQVAEFKTTSSDKTLNIPSPEAVAATILSGFSPLKADQAVLMQWVISPIDPNRHPAITPENKDKYSERNFLSVCRLASLGPDADTLIRHLFTSLASTHAQGMRFVKRTVPSKQVKERIWRRSGMLAYPSTFNAKELSVLLGFPFGAPNVPGLPRGRARHLAADHMIPTDGVVIGRSSFPGMEERKLAIPIKALMMHQWVLGGTGAGKSTLLHNEAVHIMQAGHGLVVIEPKGDLARDIIKSVPADRAGDVIWFDPTDLTTPIGLNVLAGPDPERTTAHLVALFKHLYGDSWGPRLEQILRYSILTAALNELTLYDVKQLLINPEFRNRTVRATRDHEIRQFWRRLEDISDIAVDSVVNKLDGFLGSRAIRNIVGQTHGLNMADVVSKHKILLVPLPAAILGEANAAMLGSLIFFELWSHIRQRPPAERYPIVGMMDEWQNYVNTAVAIEDMLAEARSYQLGLVLDNQHTGQLPAKVLEAVKANARSKVVFGISRDDADKMHKELPPLNASDLQTLGQYEVAAQLMTETGTAPVATARTAPPPIPVSSGRALIEASRAVYGRDYKDVENELARGHRGMGEESERPVIGGLE